MPGTIEEVCELLHTLVPMLNNTHQLVQLLQRYTVPFGAIPGTPHSSLSGQGSFPVSGLLGVQVVVLGDLPGRQLEGTPPYIWDLGWMSIMTDEGMILEQRITREVQVWQPPMMTQATTFGYYLKPGVTANINEFGPEPY